MILKIRVANKSDGWFVFDQAEEVFFSRHPYIRPFFHDSMGVEADTNVIATAEGSGIRQGSFFLMKQDSVSEQNGEGWFLSFERDGQAFEFWGDTEAYMLNDNGKTIERIG